ncbi:MAG TPA: AMP-binding protein, partial [Thermoanaerobaculia bacterium]|nr:AMP-binding protein [Thermoanaerobaculia bacterium]
MISADVLGERARLTPDAPALVVVDPPLRLTYRELDGRAVRCAAAWRTMGIVRGDRVAILAGNRVEYLEAFFAAGKSGAILVTLGTRATAHELLPVVADCAPRVLLYDGAFAATVAALRAGGAGAGAIASIERWIALDAPLDAADASYAELVAAADPSAFVRERCDPEDVYCLLYTSGTTGRPKGVMIPHRQVAWNGYNTVCSWQLRSDDVAPIFTPLYHAGGLFAFLVPIVTIGGTVVLHRGFDAAEVWRTIERERCTMVLGVPTIWKLLLDALEAPELAGVDLTSVRTLLSGGAPLPTWLAEAYQRRGLTFKQGFGMTEVGVNCFAMTDEASVSKRGSIGTPLMHTEVRLVGADGRDVALGEVGEMWFRGPHVSLGYWDRPDATAESRAPGGWFRSGDLARRDEDGYYYVAGRAKEMFISGGVNVYPVEIEAALLQHPGVRDAAVVGVEDPTWGEVGVGFVVELAEGAAPA